MEIVICSVKAVATAIARKPPGLVISALRQPINQQTKNHHQFAIDDIYNHFIQQYKDTIRRTLRLAEGEDYIVVHCRHGLSRSAALALIIAYNQSPDAVDELLDMYPKIEPNPLLLLYGDEILKADGDLLRRCKGRYKGALL